MRECVTASPQAVPNARVRDGEHPSMQSMRTRTRGVDTDVIDVDVVYADEYTRHSEPGSMRHRIVVDAADM
jgi:hypothetical protein